MLNNTRTAYSWERKLLSSRFGKWLDLHFWKLLFLLFKLLPVQSKRITFISFHYDFLYGNNKAIFDELKHQIQLGKRDDEIHLIFKSDLAFSHGFSWTKFKRKIQLAYLYNTSAFVLLDDYYSLLAHIQFKKQVKIIQVWHGTGVFKRFGLSRPDMDEAQRVLNKRIGAQYHAVLSSCEAIVPLLSEAFAVPEYVMKSLGSPKTDVFFQPEQIKSLQERFFQKYPHFQGKKIILYAPTFRDHDRYRDLELDIEAMHQAFADQNYILLLKMHHFERKKIQLNESHLDFAFDVSDFDVNHLMLVAHVLITDYSSLIYEYACLQKPVIFYAYDLEHYVRGFYLPYQEFVPGPIVTTTAEIIDLIQQDTWDITPQKVFVDKFIANQGKASKAVVEEVFKS